MPRWRGSGDVHIEQHVLAQWSDVVAGWNFNADLRRRGLVIFV